MLEAYEAYGDYNSMAELTRELVQEAALAANGSLVVPLPAVPGSAAGGEMDLSGSWRQMTVHGALSAVLGENVTPDTGLAELRRLAAAAGVQMHPEWQEGQIVLQLYEKLVEATTVEPTFYRDFPTEVAPLTRAHRSDPRLAERWDLVALGRELATAYSRTGRPGGATAAPHGAIAQGGGRRSGGNAARRGLPAGPGTCHAAFRGDGHGGGKTHHAAHRQPVDPGDDAVPTGSSRVAAVVIRPTNGVEQRRTDECVAGKATPCSRLASCRGGT